MKICRICLTKEDMLYPISSNGLQSLYHQLTGTLNLAVDAEETLPQWVCEECGLRLMSYDKMRQKSLKSHQTLCRLLESVTFITEEELDRTKKDLQSNAIDSAINYGILLRDPLDTPDQGEFDTGNIIEEDLNEVEGTTNNLQSDSSNPVDSGRLQEDPLDIPDASELDTENMIEVDLNAGEATMKDLQSNASNIVNRNTIKHEDLLNGLGLGEIITENIIEDDSNEYRMNNDLNSNLSNSLNNNEIKHEVSLNILDLGMAENINEIDSLNNGLNSTQSIKAKINKSSLLEGSTEIQATVPKPKIKDFVLDLEESAFVFETRSVSSTDCLPENEIRDKDNNLGLEEDFILKSLSHTENNSSTNVTSLITKNKEKNIMTKVDFMETLQKKLPHLGVRKMVMTKTVGEKKVKKKKVGKKKVVTKVKDELTFEELIIVKELSFKEQKAEFKRRKYLSNYTNALFKCHVCFKGFYTEAILSRHKLVHSEKMGTIECDICKKRLRTNANYNYHMDSHRYVFSCKICKFTASHRSTAVLHVRKHRGKVYKCPQCEEQFDDKSSCNYHRRLMHVSKFVCEYCGLSFVSDKGVEQHKRNKHSFENSNKISSVGSPTCEICKIWFVSKEALNTHLKVSHPKKSDIKIIRNEADFGTTRICELCGVKLCYKAYSKHYRRHFASTENQNAKQYICEQCGKVFRDKKDYRRHQVVHTKLKPYECDHCHWRFGMKSSLKLHILNKHLPKKNIHPKVYPCSICDKTFKWPSTRKRHMDVHSGQLASYPCRTCGKCFTCPGSRKRHNTTAHLKSGPSFVCQICDKSFTTKHKLKEHILHIHQNVPRPTKKRPVT